MKKKAEEIKLAAQNLVIASERIADDLLDAMGETGYFGDHIRERVTKNLIEVRKCADELERLNR